MSPKSRSQAAQPSSATPRSTGAPLKLSSERPIWRCDLQGEKGRLHRDSEDCTGTPPTSPIIDTPAKRERLLKKKNALLPDSQTTEPTPSAPPRQRPQMEADPADEEEQEQQEEEEESLGFAKVQEVDENNAHENDHESQQLPSHLSRTPSLAASERTPETPLGLGLDLPSSPPLPALTSANLSLHDQQTATNQPAASDGTNIPASASGVIVVRNRRIRTPESISSLATSVRDLISRLVFQERASQEQYEAANEALGRETARRRAWRDALVALVVLCLAYVCWCYYNSADFEFIIACRRDWYGL